MAEDGEAEHHEGEEGGEAHGKRKLPGRLMVMIGGGAAVFLLIIGVVLYLLLSGGSKETAANEHGDHATEHAEEAPAAEGKTEGKGEGKPAGPAMVELDDLIVNLSTQPGKKASYLKLKLVLEMEKGEAPSDTAKSRVIDAIQIYLRELRREDLDGSAGVVRLKEELLQRVNAVLAPMEVRNVLFKDFLIQ